MSGTTKKKLSSGYGKTVKPIDYKGIESEIQSFLNQQVIKQIYRRWTGQEITSPSGPHGFSNLPCPRCCNDNSSKKPFSINLTTGKCKCRRTSCELFKDDRQWLSIFEAGSLLLRKSRDQIAQMVADKAGIRVDGLKIKPQEFYYPSKENATYRKIKYPNKSYKFERLADDKWESGLNEDEKDEIRCLFFEDLMSSDENKKKIINFFEGEKDCMTAIQYSIHSIHSIFEKNHRGKYVKIRISEDGVVDRTTLLRNDMIHQRRYTFTIIVDF